MKFGVILIFIALLFNISCKKQEVKKSSEKKQSIKIDTTYEGEPGKKGYSISIYHKYNDSTKTEWHNQYLNAYNKIDYRNQYYDNKNNIRLNYCRLWYNDKLTISYSWDDKFGQVILSVDTTFQNNKLASTEITIYREKPILNENLSYIIEKKYRNNKITETQIHDFNLSYNFSEEGNEYYEMETDVNYKSAEWESSSKSRFGRSYTDALQELHKAYSRIDSTYLTIAKVKHNFDLYSFVLKETGL